MTLYRFMLYFVLVWYIMRSKGYGDPSIMDYALYITLGTIFAAFLFDVWKSTKDKKFLSKEHDSLSKEHDSLSKEHSSLSTACSH